VALPAQHTHTHARRLLQCTCRLCSRVSRWRAPNLWVCMGCKHSACWTETAMPQSSGQLRHRPGCWPAHQQGKKERGSLAFHARVGRQHRPSYYDTCGEYPRGLNSVMGHLESESTCLAPGLYVYTRLMG